MTDASAQTVAHHFAEVREALFAWKAHDNPAYEFFVKDLRMIEREKSVCLCAIIPINEAEAKNHGFVLVRESWAPMFPAHHVSCAELPADGVWTAPIHEKNVERLYNYMREAYGDQTLQAESKAREMVAIRRQLMMYAKIHPASSVDQRPTQLETAVFVDARISGDTGAYLTALSEFVGKFPEGELNTI
jgi:hypothetical protein